MSAEFDGVESKQIFLEVDREDPRYSTRRSFRLSAFEDLTHKPIYRFIVFRQEELRVFLNLEKLVRQIPAQIDWANVKRWIEVCFDKHRKFCPVSEVHLQLSQEEVERTHNSGH